MKISGIKILSLLSLALFLGGCIVQSTQPFYTKAVMTPVPETLKGEWVFQRKKSSVKITNPRNWKLTSDTLVTYNKHNIEGRLRIKFFTVNGILYCDSTANSPDDKQHNMYWVSHVSPMHMLSRVKISDKQLQFILINANRLKSIISENKLALATTKAEGQLFIAKSNQWVQFLETYGSDPKLFGEKSEKITLKRK